MKHFNFTFLIFSILTPPIAQSEFVCSALSDEILQKQQIGTYYNPRDGYKEISKTSSNRYQSAKAIIDEEIINARVEFIKNNANLSRQEALKRFEDSPTQYEFDKKLKKLKDDFKITVGAEFLIDANIHYVSSIYFADKLKKNEVTFFYEKDNFEKLNAIFIRDPYHSLNTDENKVLIIKDCKIKKIHFVTPHKRILSSELCQNLSKIANIAKPILYDRFRFKCIDEAGISGLNDHNGESFKDPRKCKCPDNSIVSIDLQKPICGSNASKLEQFKRKDFKPYQWDVFENFIKDHNSDWSPTDYTRDTYTEIESECEKYKGYLYFEEEKIPPKNGEPPKHPGVISV